ncbi:MAG: radical SAM protein [Nanoarchaeota archaeon]|nr:radical SAM protein [Nanoarchaeota archaeon]
MNKTKIALISCEVDLISNGLRSISSQLKKHGYQTKIIFLPRYYPSYVQETLTKLYNTVKDSNLIGMYCMDQSFEKAVQIIKFLKSKDKGKKIILGGIYATLNPRECLQYVDFVCIGEGEGAILDLVNSLEQNKDTTKIMNIWAKKEGKTYKNDVRPLIKDINALPFEDYDFSSHYVLIGEDIVQMTPGHMKYGPHNLSNEFLSIMRNNFVTVHTTRGCPYSCKYCCNYDLKQIYNGKGSYVRKRHIKNVIAELEKLKEGIPNLAFIWFTDDDFLIRSKVDIEHFAKEYREKIKLHFMCYTAPTTLEAEKLNPLIFAGLCRVEMGIQTGSEAVNRKVYGRDIKNSEVIRAARILNKMRSAMSYPEYQIICMNPIETKNDIIQTVQLIRQLPTPFFLRPFNMSFFHGSYMWKKAHAANLARTKAEDCSSVFYSDYTSYLEARSDMSTEVLYLNTLLNLMRGSCNRLLYGKVPRFALGLLLNQRLASSRFCLDLLTRLLNLSPYIKIHKIQSYSRRIAYLRLYTAINREIYKLRVKIYVHLGLYKRRAKMLARIQSLKSVKSPPHP